VTHVASFQFEGSVEGWLNIGGGAPSISTTQKRTGAYSLQVAAGSTVVGQMGTSLALAYLGAGNFQSSYMNEFYIGVRKSGVNVARLQFDAMGRPTLHYQGGALSVTNPDFLYTLEAMHYIEMMAEIGSSADIICKIDGDIIISLLNADTRASAGAITDVSEIVIFNPFTAACYIDDVWVDDSDWPDGIKLLPVDVDGDGDEADVGYVASGSDPKYPYIDDFPPNSADYIQTATASQKISFTTAALPGLGANVDYVGVQVIHYSHEPNGVSGKTLDPFLRVGSTNYPDGVDHELTSDVQFYQGKMHETNPAGGAWDDTAINALQIGLASSA
jgi:hypothetical protein